MATLFRCVDNKQTDKHGFSDTQKSTQHNHFEYFDTLQFQKCNFRLF